MISKMLVHSIHLRASLNLFSYNRMVILTQIDLVILYFIVHVTIFCILFECVYIYAFKKVLALNFRSLSDPSLTFLLSICSCRHSFSLVHNSFVPSLSLSLSFSCHYVAILYVMCCVILSCVPSCLLVGFRFITFSLLPYSGFSLCFLHFFFAFSLRDPHITSTAF